MNLSCISCKNYIFLSLLFLLSICIFASQHHIRKYKGLKAKIESLMRLPRGEYVKTAALEYEQLVADAIWLETIQILGDKVVSPAGYEWAYHALDVVTTLDPKFSYAYELGAINLAVLGHRPDLANRLLEKGIKENPEVWRLPFYLGFNKFFYLKDYKAAAKYMAMASKLPGHPAYLPRLAARLYVQAGSPELALDFLRKIYRETRDENVRKSIEKRIKEVIVERDIKFLESAIGTYEKVFGHPPANLSELVKRGILKTIPQEPFGGYYYVDSEGNVHSSNIQERMRIYGKN